MTDKALAVVNAAAVSPFDIDVPAPGAPLLNRIIHPRNIAADERQRTVKPLKPATVKKAHNRSTQLQKQLKTARFDALQAQFEQVKEQIILIMIRLQELAELIEHYESLPSDSSEIDPTVYLERDLLMREASALRAYGLPIRDSLAALMPVAREYKSLKRRLDEHHLAIERGKLHDALAKGLAKESYNYAEIIIETWAGLGYAHRFTRKNKIIVHKVAFSEIHVTPDEIFYKISASFKAMFGFKRRLPYGVRVTDLIKEDTLTELTTACQRQVSARLTQTNGVWIVVHRLGTTDGLLEHVTLEQVLNNYDDDHHKGLPIPMGVGMGRAISWIQIAQHPHFLIGGTTGGGKSNLINVIICSLIQKHSPAEVQFILIDLKEGLEFGHYESIPHLLGPVVKEIDDASTTLLQLEQLRKERARQLAKYYAKDIDQYNARVDDDSKKMPRIVVIFDEYAAIQVRRDFANAIQNSVMQLLNKGRAAGIHLVLCTQNPSVDIIPGPSKANMAFRIAGQMPTKSASMTILGVGDAADLPDIPGRMVAMVGARIWKVQTPHVRESDLEQAIAAAKAWGDNPLTITLPQPDGSTIGFSESDVIDAAISHCGGSLSVRPLYQILSESGVSYRQLGNIIKRLTLQKDITHEEQVYRVVRRRKAYYLEIVESSAAPEAEMQNTQ